MTKIQDAPNFVRLFSETVRKFSSCTCRHDSTPVYVPSSLKSWSHVFVHVELQRKSLQSRYTGSYRVIFRDDKTVTIDMEERLSKCLHRVKPAFILNDPVTIQVPLKQKPQTSVTIVLPRQRGQSEHPVRFKGRHPRYPSYLLYFIYSLIFIFRYLLFLQLCASVFHVIVCILVIVILLFFPF